MDRSRDYSQRPEGALGNRRLSDLAALRESRGAAIAVEDRAMLEAMREIAELEGVVTSPEGGATLAGLKRLLNDGLLGGYETVVLFLTGSGYKYLEALEASANDPLVGDAGR